jgi:DNA polymerase zeta
MSSDSRPPALRVRINQIDHMMVKSDILDNSTLHRVPVIRVYGDSSKGVKACVCIHQVYPYFFVEYTGSLHPEDGTHGF